MINPRLDASLLCGTEGSNLASSTGESVLAATSLDVTALLDLVQAGKLQAVIDETFPLGRAEEALLRLENRQVFGKLAVTP